ncbi:MULTISPECIES: hypothetical protein [Candidatus Nitrosocaldus]|jgi:hypothetical protein|uniref:Uncharacterized protein n=1 Tax=Candidatus Nitrosocaldus cavascurensis TaxID=2058097 RepID=A0A2K5AQB6_9ARCH|nr:MULTISPECIES: hypothetical protein [Candidatus Nitrosocaldus]SPC33814.1 protein of unknown function [Candidatus Nitrosocaldus cavascurensis]
MELICMKEHIATIPESQLIRWSNALLHLQSILRYVARSSDPNTRMLVDDALSWVSYLSTDIHNRIMECNKFYDGISR